MGFVANLALNWCTTRRIKFKDKFSTRDLIFVIIWHYFKKYNKSAVFYRKKAVLYTV